MTLEQLRIFLAVAELQHITRAAEGLHMTQSAVSAAVSALESRHGVTLFDRVGRSIVLNEAGRTFLPEAQAVLDRAKAAQGALDDLSRLLRGRLSVMASQTVADYWLPRRLVAYRQMHPRIELDMAFGNTGQVADGVESGLAELGLVEGQVNRPALSVDLLDQDEMIVVVGAGHAWTEPGVAQAAGYGGTAWVLRETGSGTRAAFDGMIARAGIDAAALDIAMVLPGNEAVLGVVEAGLGATLVSRAVARARVVAGLLTVVDLPIVRRSFYLLRHKERYRTKAAEAFLAMVGSARANG